MADNTEKPSSDSLMDSLVKLTGQVAGGTLELARTTATMTAMPEQCNGFDDDCDGILDEGVAGNYG